MTDENTLEAARFNRTLQRYALYSKKNMRQIVDKASLDVAFRALSDTPRADKGAIEALPKRQSTKYPGKPFWPIYIASRLSKVGFAFKTKRKGVTTHTTIQGSYTRAQAQQVSARILNSRKRAIGYVASGWLPAVRLFWGRVKDKPFGSTKGAKQFGGPKGKAVSGGSEWSPYSIIMNNATGVVKVGAEALRAAMIWKRGDMAIYVGRKSAEAARRARLG